MTFLKAAVIGLGVGEQHIEGFERHSACRVTVLCDIDHDRLAAVGARHPGRSLVSDPGQVLCDPNIDAVSIASYDDAHFQQVVTALEHGKHVFVEKPLCQTDVELDGIHRALLRHRGLRLSSNLPLRRVPRFLDLRARIQSGAMGTLYHVEGDYNYGRLHKITEGWRGALPSYSVMKGGGIHMVDLLLWFTGQRVTEVFAMGNRIASKGSQVRFDDMVVATLRFSGGAVGKVAANFGCVYPHFHRLSIYGTAGTFVNEPNGARYHFSRDPVDPGELVDGSYSGTDKGAGVAAFVNAILTGERPDVTEQDVFDAMSVCLAIDRSNIEGAPCAVHYREIS
ncbi:Gfo/Idh/MocA family protein [Azospirillum aestuarii]|uniref:Gfo/Idh/MocA family protein n=1 Tax=Azospirillum aestuarii TaxID=2802052 RepID=UPI004054EC28